MKSGKFLEFQDSGLFKERVLVIASVGMEITYNLVTCSVRLTSPH